MISIENWLLSIGFVKISNNIYKLDIKLPNNIHKDCLIDINNKTKDDILNIIKQAKLDLIISYMGGIIVNKDNFSILENYIISMGYKKVNDEWICTIDFSTDNKEYKKDVIIKEEEFNNMTLNDAMIYAIDKKVSEERNLAFEIKMNIENENFVSDYVNEMTAKTKCPTCDN